MKKFMVGALVLLAATLAFGQGVVPGNTFVPFLNISNLSTVFSTAAGVVQLRNPSNSRRIGFQFNAVPAIQSGFGTSPSIVSGSNDSAGAVDVGTGGAATSGVINFGSTWSAAPFCLAGPVDTTTAVVTRASTTTTQLTLTASAAWPASLDVAWVCIGQ